MATTVAAESTYQLRKMMDGGYLVRPGENHEGMYPAYPCFACTTIEEALKYIKGKLEPKPAK